jgi:hypothetical protein
VPTFADRGVSRGQPTDPPRPLISVFWTGAATASGTLCTILVAFPTAKVVTRTRVSVAVISKVHVLLSPRSHVVDRGVTGPCTLITLSPSSSFVSC